MFGVSVRSGFQLARTTAVNIARCAAFAASFAQPLTARSNVSPGSRLRFGSSDGPGASCINTTAHTQ